MELASMLAGETFSDQPASVCPVIGSFLRAYNDSIDDERRQDLYEYASKVVGSRTHEEVQRARAEHLTAWGRQLRQRRWTRFVPRRLRALAWMQELDVIGPQVVRSIATHDERSHAESLAMIDALLAIGARDGEQTPLTTEASAAPALRP